jgi:hypothetical protein
MTLTKCYQMPSDSFGSNIIMTKTIMNSTSPIYVPSSEIFAEDWDAYSTNDIV